MGQIDDALVALAADPDRGSGRALGARTTLAAATLVRPGPVATR